MIPALLWITLGFFVIISFLDWKFKAVPSVFMTGMLFIVAFINTIFVDPSTLTFGVLSYIFARLIYEIDENRGIADTKATMIIGFMIPTYQIFVTYILLLLVFQFIYTVIIRKFLNKKGDFPFLPVYLITYIILMIGVWV